LARVLTINTFTIFENFFSPTVDWSRSSPNCFFIFLIIFMRSSAIPSPIMD